MGIVFLCISCILLAISIYFLWVSIGFCKSKTSKCKGFLKEVTHYKNKYVGGVRGRFYKDYIDYVYEYRVNGNKFLVSGGCPGTKGNLSNVVDIVYQKSRPKLSYIKQLTFPIHPICSTVFFVFFALFLILGIMMSI